MTTGLIIFIGGIIGFLCCMIGVYCVDRHMVKKINLYNKKQEKKNKNNS